MALSGSIGEIRDVEACFTRLADEAARERTDAKYGGSFLEFGYYSLLPIIKLFGVSYDSFQIDSITGKDGIDLYTKVQIRYPDSMATAKMGVGVKSEGELVIAGTDGYILAQSVNLWHKLIKMRRVDINLQEKKQLLWLLLQNLS